jgi:DNA-binding protein HU-beta
LNRKELVDAIQQHTEVARADVERVLSSLIQQTQVAIKKGDRVSLVGFGTFERRDRRARTARNPRTGDVVKVKATKVPAFRPGQGFKDAVSGKAPAAKAAPATKPARSAAATKRAAKAAAAPAALDSKAKGKAKGKATKAAKTSKTSKASAKVAAKSGKKK